MVRLVVVETNTIVTSSLAYDDHDTGKVTIIIGHQWVRIPKMENIFFE